MSNDKAIDLQTAKQVVLDLHAELDAAAPAPTCSGSHFALRSLQCNDAPTSSSLE